MKNLALLGTLLFGCIAPLAAAPKYERIAEPMAPRNIQVLLEKESPGVLLEVKGPYYIFNPEDGSRVSSGLIGKRFMVHELESGLKWGEEFPDVHQIYIKPRDEDTAIFINGIQYAGSIAIYGVNGLINVVNDLDVESYVKATLTNSCPTAMESEVMSALAILARTDAYHYVDKAAPTAFWHISAEDTGYQGSALIVDGSAVDKAVESTRHLILLHADHGRNAPFAATWTEHSAGKTAGYTTIFRKESSLSRGVDAPHAQIARQETKWSYQIGKKALAYLLNVPAISSLETFQEAGKVYGLRIKNNGAATDVDFLALQEVIGQNNLKSSDFVVTVKDDTVTFTGFGRGHGVGLCLYSANALAQNGENAVKILSKFFPETYLYNLNAVPR